MIAWFDKLIPRFPIDAVRSPTAKAASDSSTAGHRAVIERLSRRADWIVRALVAMPVVLMIVGATVAWRQSWTDARAELENSADAVAQFGLRTLNAHAAAAGRIDALLRGLSDDEIRMQGPALHAALRRIVLEVPQAEASYIIDRIGRILASSNIFPGPRELASVAERDFFLALQAHEAPDVHVSQVYRGKLSGALFFTISRRRKQTGNSDVSPDAFDGLVNISANPNQIANDLRTLAKHAQDVLSLIRADGEIISRSTGLPDRQHISESTPYMAALAAGTERVFLEQVPVFTKEPYFFALRRVDDWPIYASAGRPRSAIVSDWRAAVAHQMAIGVPATGALLLLTGMLRQSQRVTAEQSIRLHALFDNDAVAIAEADGMGRLTDVNSRFCALVGTSRHELLGGMAFVDLALPEDIPQTTSLLQADVDRRAATSSHEQRYRRSDGTTFWGASHLALSYGKDGRLSHVVAAVQDISDRRAADAHHVLLVRELDHRAKNLLAVVQAVVKLTPKSDPVNYVRDIEGRLAALARVHNLLADDLWRGAPLRRLAEAELAGFQTEEAMLAAPQVLVEGPEVQLQPAAAQGLAMVFHELATNAAKHGALSAPGGQVQLTWGVDSTVGLFRLRWIERGGPKVEGAPTRSGFGTRLITSTLHTQLGGTVEKTWSPGGLLCVVALPIDRTLAS